MDSFPILSLITFLPLVGVAFILVTRGTEEQVARNARWGALWTSLFTFVISLLLWFNFDKTTADFQFVEKFDWLPSFGISYHMGIDGISLFFVILSTFLTPICVLASWKAITMRVKEYMIAFLVLETMMIGTFAALDFVMFYIFFEAVLIPMFIIIGVWGGPRRVYSAFKFFLYTLAGSVLLLAALLTLYFEVGTTDIPTLIAYAVPPEMQTWLWLAFFASFAVKMPMWPVHTWLPMLPLASEMFVPLIYTLSVIAIIYTSLVALAQEDMKKLIAYSSVAHMGFVTIGIFTATQQGIDGALFQMLSHGIISAALFLCVGVIYDREHSREISHYGGLVERMPRYAFVFMVFMLGAVGLPGTGGFVGEFLILVGAFQDNTWVALLASTGVILGAAYMLFLYRRVIFGKLEKEHLRQILDLEPREMLIFAPLIVLVIWMGIWPDPFLSVFDATVSNLLLNYQSALAVGGDALNVAGR